MLPFTLVSIVRSASVLYSIPVFVIPFCSCFRFFQSFSVFVFSSFSFLFMFPICFGRSVVRCFCFITYALLVFLSCFQSVSVVRCFSFSFSFCSLSDHAFNLFQPFGLSVCLLWTYTADTVHANSSSNNSAHQNQKLGKAIVQKFIIWSLRNPPNYDQQRKPRGANHAGVYEWGGPS